MDGQEHRARDLSPHAMRNGGIEEQDLSRIQAMIIPCDVDAQPAVKYLNTDDSLGNVIGKFTARIKDK